MIPIYSIFLEEEVRSKLVKTLGQIIEKSNLRSDDSIQNLARILATFKSLDEAIFQQFLEHFKPVVNKSDPEESLMAYVNHADFFPNEAAEILLEKPKEMLSNSRYIPFTGPAEPCWGCKSHVYPSLDKTFAFKRP